MYIKFSRSFILSLFVLFLFSAVSFAASESIILNGDAHVGEQVVLSAAASQVPNGGSVAWSVNPTTGKNPDRILLRAGGMECAFTPLDTEPIKVFASFLDREGNEVSNFEVLVTPKEFQIDVAVVIDKPLTLWDASKRSNYVLSPDVLLANSPLKIRASLNPAFKGEHTFKWNSDAATALLSQDNSEIFIRRGTIGESEIYVTAFNSSGIKLGSGESKVKISLPVSTFDESNNQREAWNSWQRSQALWESKNYAEAVEIAKKAVNLSPRDSEIVEGLRAMNTNFARFTKAEKLRADAKTLDSNKKYEESLKNLRSAQVIWPLDNGDEEIKAIEEKVNEQRVLQQQANWLRDTASAYDNENMYEDALEYYAKSLEIWPSDAVSERVERIKNRLTLIADADKYAGEGNTLEREGKLQDALNHYSASIMSNPDATLRQHIDELQSVISRRERQANALYREGQDLQRRNNNQEALKRYTESMKVWENDNAKQRIQQLSRNTRLAPDAVIRGAEDFGIGTRIDAQKISQNADELYSQGNIDEALELYKKALSISPSDDLRKWVAKLDGIIKDRDAVEAANKLINDANALFKAGKTKEALELYKQSLSVHKNSEVESFIQRQGK
ncbi:MAG: tetratricopeptide repeat protein [Synergistaceae bacterium]|nr:tetratricopeptide repeat protein [Synergistaceae bacterium]